MVLVRGNVMNPIARKGQTVEVEDSEHVLKLVSRGVLEYVETEVEAVEDESNPEVDEYLDDEDE